jgi:hypothetical protein
VQALQACGGKLQTTDVKSDRITLPFRGEQVGPILG